MLHLSQGQKPLKAQHRVRPTAGVHNHLMLVLATITRATLPSTAQDKLYVSLHLFLTTL